MIFVGCVLRCMKFERMRTNTVRRVVNSVGDTLRSEATMDGFYLEFHCFGALSAPYQTRFKNCRVMK